VAHFNANVRRGCKFCVLNRLPVIPDEDFLHLFFLCPSVKGIITRFFNSLLLLDNEDDIRKTLFTGLLPENTTQNSFLLLVVTTILNFVWQCKLQKKLPTLENLLNDLYFSADAVIKCSLVIRDAMNLNLPLCRSWRAEADRRRF
jgi:hypothetical protein